MGRKKLLLVATGGTISSVASSGGLIPGRTGADFAQEVKLDPGWTVDVVDAGQSLSSAFGLSDMLHLSDLVTSAQTDAVVVLHGTGIMEEAVFLTDMKLAAALSSKAVVFTGAQRVGSDAGSDGLQNLRDAVYVATRPFSGRFGACIVFDGHVFAASQVTKSDSWSLHAFSGGDAGALARVFPEGMVVMNWPAWRFPCEARALEPLVDLIWFSGGMDGDRLPLDGLKGVVVAASGVGNVNGSVANRIREAIERGIVVLVATRTGQGPVFSGYGGEGGSQTLAAMGVHFTSLHPLKARLLLMAALRSQGPIGEVLAGEAWGP